MKISDIKDDDLFCVIGALGRSLVGVIKQKALDRWRAGGTLAVLFPRVVVVTQDGRIALRPVHPVASEQSEVELRDASVEVVGLVTGNAGSCTDCSNLFCDYMRLLREMQAARTGVVEATAADVAKLAAMAPIPLRAVKG